MKNRGSTLISTNLVGVHPRNINTKFGANLCSGSREEVEKLEKLHADNDGHRVIASHTHSLSVTKYMCADVIISCVPPGFRFVIVVVDKMEATSHSS